MPKNTADQKVKRLFFQHQGPVDQTPVEEDKSVNTEFYVENIPSKVVLKHY